MTAAEYPALCQSRAATTFVCARVAHHAGAHIAETGHWWGATIDGSNQRHAPYPPMHHSQPAHTRVAS
jgi:hypothetical protein